MREIKFRGWNGVEMLKPQDLSQSGKFWQWLGNVDAVLMQYIGEKDKNGVEMYEGDRINVGNFKNQIVSFKDGYFGWGEEHNGLYSFDPFQSETCEVIGNIYEDKK